MATGGGERGKLAFKLRHTEESAWIRSTSYGKELARISKEGKYSPEAQSSIVGQVGARAGQVAQEQKADMRGYLEARGMGNSIAGAKALSAPDTARMRTVGQTAGNLASENEISKTRAKLDYARARMGYGEQVRSEENTARSELIGGLAGAAGSAYSGYVGDQNNQNFDTDFQEAQRLMGSGNPEDLNQAEMILSKWMMRYGYAQ